ncbi:low molecular weight phosphatase family protein [Candidatus Bathyarchaeota archaeon]|nr:low molecular weight phosphatase family protein [Candidatus Bathyarchaeota archaeon]
MRILFICSGNAHRSPLAEALLRKLRPNWTVESAGTHVAIPISEEARAFLATENAEQYLKPAPEDLDSKPLRNYDLIVAMEQKHKNAVLRKCPECESRIVVWGIEDPFLMQHEDAKRIYEQIKGKVAALAKSR